MIMSSGVYACMDFVGLRIRLLYFSNKKASLARGQAGLMQLPEKRLLFHEHPFGNTGQQWPGTTD
jgi:hypothetical protein